MERDDILAYAKKFASARRKVFWEDATTYIVGHINLNPVVIDFAKSGRGNPEYMWFIFPETDTKLDEVVTEIIPGVFVNHRGKVIEHDRGWTISFGEASYLFDTIIIPGVNDNAQIRP